MASSLVFVESPFGPGRLMLAPAGARLPAGVYPVKLLAVAGAPSRTSARRGHAVVAALGAGSPTGGAGVGGRAAGFAAASVVAAVGTSSLAGGAAAGGRGAGYAASVAAAAGLAGAGGLHTRGVHLVAAAGAGEPGDGADDVTAAGAGEPGNGADDVTAAGAGEPGDGADDVTAAGAGEPGDGADDVTAAGAGEPGDGADDVNQGDKKPLYLCLPYYASVSSKFETLAVRGLVALEVLVVKEQAYAEPEGPVARIYDWASMCLRRLVAESDKGYVYAEHVVAATRWLQRLHGLAPRCNVVPEPPPGNVPLSTMTPEAYFELLGEEFELTVSALEEIAF
ncbi:hypothetical protein ACP70R_005170 [Stipagrostis hirtigluma subsp. patula]